MLLIATIAGILIAPASNTTVDRSLQRPIEAAPLQLAGKAPRKFKEIEQPVQFEGDYSPRVGRSPTPEPSATVPVRFMSASERAIPIVVAPAPRYVDEAAPTTNAIGTTPPMTIGSSAQASESVEPDLSNPTPLAGGSATGSNAVPSYGGLPN